MAFMIFPSETKEQEPIYSYIHRKLGKIKSKEQIDQDLKVMVNAIVGYKISYTDLDGFYRSGMERAKKLEPYFKRNYRVLEYGGGIGRLAKFLAPFCRKLVSVDVSPLMKRYGKILCPKVDFLNLEESKPKQQFDLCYSVAVFFHLDHVQHETALKYIHQRLKPGGIVLIDLVLGLRDISPKESGRTIETTDRRRFLSQCEKYYDVKFVKLFNNGLLLRKRST